MFWDKLSALFSPQIPTGEEFIADVNDVDNDNNVNDANNCWRLVKQCKWVTYKTVCANKPVDVCKVSKKETKSH